MSLKPRITPIIDAFGWFFCLVWAAAVLAFPLVKGQSAGYVPIVVGAGMGILALRLRKTIAWLNTLAPGRFLVLAVGIAAVLRAAAIAYFPLQPMVDDAQFHRYALAMVRGEGYGAPGVRAWFPPGMSLVLTAWYVLTTPSPVAGKILQLIFGCLLVWQTWATARQFFSEEIARVASLLVAVFPTLVFYTATLGYETLLGLVLLLACRLAVPVAGAAGVPFAGLMAVGALLGLGALLKPICLLVPVVFAAAWWTLGTRLPAIAGRVVIVVAVMVLVISPWTLRNYRVLGAFVPISTNGGTTLYAANNPRATGLAILVDPLPGETDEVSRDRVRMRGALSWMLNHPGRWFELALTKVTYTWGTSSSIMSVVSTDRLPPTAEAISKAVLNVSWTALLVWCMVATATGSPWSRVGMIPATLVIAYIFGLHLFYEALSRHHVPVVPFLCMIAATALARKLPGRG